MKIKKTLWISRSSRQQQQQAAAGGSSRQQQQAGAAGSSRQFIIIVTISIMNITVNVHSCIIFSIMVTITIAAIIIFIVVNIQVLQTCCQLITIEYCCNHCQLITSAITVTTVILLLFLLSKSVLLSRFSPCHCYSIITLLF